MLNTIKPNPLKFVSLNNVNTSFKPLKIKKNNYKKKTIFLNNFDM